MAKTKQNKIVAHSDSLALVLSLRLRMTVQFNSKVRHERTGVTRFKKKSNKLVFKFPTQYFIQAQYKKNVIFKHQESDHVFYCLRIIPFPP